jgi:ubiquitin C-terminal hydrolase
VDNERFIQIPHRVFPDREVKIFETYSQKTHDYELHAIICYSGSDNMGHYYVAVPVKDKDEYLIVSDDKISVTSEHNAEFVKEVFWLIYNRKPRNDAEGVLKHLGSYQLLLEWLTKK